MGPIPAAKVWRLRDIRRVEEGGKEIVRILKLSHPFRRQRITIIPAPRYALEEYYNDWVYQPYVKEHTMYVSNDIYNPFYVFFCRNRLTKGVFPGYAYFHPMGFPDCIDLNLTRREFLKREQPFKTPTSTILLTSTRFRDAHHPWVARRTLKVVGENYVVHPRENTSSMVFVLPPAYTPDLVNTLTGLGFNVVDSIDAPIGEETTLTKLERWSSVGQSATLCYLWVLIMLVIVGEAKHINKLFQDYKREMVEKAGKDPAEMGL